MQLFFKNNRTIVANLFIIVSVIRKYWNRLLSVPSFDVTPVLFTQNGRL